MRSATLWVVALIVMMVGAETTRPKLAVATSERSGSALTLPTDDASKTASGSEPTSTKIDVSGITFELRGFADDPGWTETMSASLTEAIPQLEQMFGVPWPPQAPTVITESDDASQVSRHGHGSELLFGPAPQRAEVYHQLAHGWLRYGPLVDAWFIEGMAEYAATSLSGDTDHPDAVPFSTPLIEWQPGGGENAADVDRQGISSSYRIFKELFDQIGDDRFRDVFWVVSISGREFDLTDWQALVYYSDPLYPDDEPVAPEFVSELMKRFVVDEAGADQIDTRKSVVAGVDALEDAAGGWGLPYVIAYALEEWDLDFAEQMTTSATATLIARDQLLDAAESAGVSVDVDDEMRDFIDAYAPEMFDAITDRFNAERTSLPNGGRTDAKQVTDRTHTDATAERATDEGTPVERTATERFVIAVGSLLVVAAVLIIGFGLFMARKRRTVITEAVVPSTPAGTLAELRAAPTPSSPGVDGSPPFAPPNTASTPD